MVHVKWGKHFFVPLTTLSVSLFCFLSWSILLRHRDIGFFKKEKAKGRHPGFALQGQLWARFASFFGFRVLGIKTGLPGFEADLFGIWLKQRTPASQTGSGWFMGDPRNNPDMRMRGLWRCTGTRRPAWQTRSREPDEHSPRVAELNHAWFLWHTRSPSRGGFP